MQNGCLSCSISGWFFLLDFLWPCLIYAMLDSCWSTMLILLELVVCHPCLNAHICAMNKLVHTWLNLDIAFLICLYAMPGVMILQLDLWFFLVECGMPTWPNAFAFQILNLPVYLTTMNCILIFCQTWGYCAWFGCILNTSICLNTW